MRHTLSSVGTTCLVVALGLLVTSCQFFKTYAEAYGGCEAPTDVRFPARLFDTGLFRAPASEELSADVQAFAPRFELWSDGATKRRWFALPEHKTIDTSDMDDWRFPEGTQFWKEFSRDGVRVETRLLEKTGPRDRDWRAVSYVWNEAATVAVATPEGAEDALGTEHDVPDAATCMGCHGGRRSRVLGFSAVQLPPDALDALVAAGRLSHPPTSTSLPLPGEQVEQRALGILHVNCSHCHNLTRPSDGQTCFNPKTDFDLALRTSELGRLEDTAVYRTALGRIFEPGDPDGSKAIKRFGHATPFRPSMPPLGTERTDDEAKQALRAWVRQLPF